MGAPDAASDERAAEHLPRLADAGDAPRDAAVLPDPYARVSPADEDLDLTAVEVSGPDRRLTDDVVVIEDGDLAPDDVPYFRYDPDTDVATSEPLPGTRVEGGNLVVDD